MSGGARLGRSSRAAAAPSAHLARVGVRVRVRARAGVKAGVRARVGVRGGGEC